MSTNGRARGPAQIGYIPWIVHRLTAVALVPLLITHIGVQLYPQYGFNIILSMGLYQALLTVTLIVVATHALLGVRSAIIGLGLTSKQTTALISIVAAVVTGILLIRIL